MVNNEFVHGARRVASLDLLKCASNYFDFWEQQQELFYGHLIDDIPGELLPETIGHINPCYFDFY